MPAMKINEISQWEEEIYLLRRNDRVLGGVNGVANTQARQLANRTQYLKALAEQQGENIDGAIDTLRGDLKSPAGW
ncbi:phage tail protein, partial [Enterobacter hormaechei]